MLCTYDLESEQLTCFTRIAEGGSGQPSGRLRNGAWELILEVVV